LEGARIASRILQWKVTPQQLEIAAFLRVEASSVVSGKSPVSILVDY